MVLACLARESLSILLLIGELFEFLQTLQATMRPSVPEKTSLELEDVISRPKRPEKVISVLSSTEPATPLNEITRIVRKKLCVNKTAKQSVAKRVISLSYGLFPILRWGRDYNLVMFRSDLMAGLTLASLGIPQSIGYAGLAMLEPQYGLYASVLPPLIYAVMGSSREIAIGPVAVVSLLLSSMIQKMVDPIVNPIGYRNLVFTATFFAGLFQAAFGLFRLGFVVDLLSHAALVGFMGGAAIVIGLQQIKGLLGITHFTNNTDVVSVMKAVWEAVHHQPWGPYNFLLGCSFLIFILATRFIGRKNNKFFWLPAIAPLLSVVLSTLIIYATRADKHGVKTIKYIRGGVNPSSIKDLQFSGPFVGETMKIGLIVAVIALIEAIAVGRSFASINGYSLDGNKEMVAMGCMNLAGSLSSCYCATGSFSRTAVNFSAGCKSTVSNMVMAVTVFVALELLTRLLYYTPTAILASIILSALPGLIDIREACSFWKVDKMDFVTCIGAFFGVLFGSVEIGILIAVSISFLKVIFNAIRPRIEILGKIPGAEVYCSIRQYPQANQVPGIIISRIDSSMLSFVNSRFIRERIMGRVAEELEIAMEEPKCKLQALVIDMSSVMDIDTSGIALLEEVNKNLASKNLQLAIVNPTRQVIHKLKRAKFVEKMGDRFFLTIGEAMDACLASSKDYVGLQC